MDEVAVGSLAAGGVGAQLLRTLGTPRIERMVTEHLPVGVGALSWFTLQSGNPSLEALLEPPPSSQ